MYANKTPVLMGKIRMRPWSFGFQQGFDGRQNYNPFSPAFETDWFNDYNLGFNYGCEKRAEKVARIVATFEEN